MSEDGERKKPNCAKCRNHSLKNKIKGHKRYCKYRYCACAKCQLTVERQRVMALQTSVRRAQAQDEERLSRESPSNENELPVSLSHPPSRVASVHLEATESSSSPPMVTNPSSAVTSTAITAQPGPPTTEMSSARANGDMLRHSINVIINRFNLSYNSVPVIYAMLKSAQFNVHQVLEHISNAQDEISEYIEKIIKNEPESRPLTSPDSGYFNYIDTATLRHSWPLSAQQRLDTNFDSATSAFLLGTSGNSTTPNSIPVRAMDSSPGILPTILPVTSPQNSEKSLLHASFLTTSPEYYPYFTMTSSTKLPINYLNRTFVPHMWC